VAESPLRLRSTLKMRLPGEAAVVDVNASSFI